MRIIVDAMGGDNAPEAPVLGAVEAAKEYGYDITLAGNGQAILDTLRKNGISELPEHITIAEASEVVEMTDDPSAVFRKKRDSSMAVGLNLVRNGEGDAFVSAGSTGALLTGATLLVRRVKGIRRAALAPVIPVNGGDAVLIDCGANAACSSEYLVQFAFLGSFYAKAALGIENPRVGLLNIGAEETKGTDLQRETYAILKKLGEEGRLNFIGNIEANTAMMGGADVIVADGYSGNIMMKAIEGTAKLMSSEMKKMFRKNPLTMVSAVLVSGGLKNLKSLLDPSRIGGTAFLGLNRPVIKAHGNSTSIAIRNAIRQAASCAQADIASVIEANIDCMRIDGTAE